MISNQGREVLLIFLSTLILLGVGGGVTYWQRQEEKMSLKVVIDGVEYPDEAFDENFDYSLLVDKEISLYEPLNRSEFASWSVETQDYEFSSLEEAWLLLEEQRAPKVVIGFARWLSNGTYEEAVKRCYGYDPGNPWDPDYPSEIHKYFGARKGRRRHVVYYVVMREGPNFDGGLDVYIHRLHIWKKYMMDSRVHMIWGLHIKLFEFPPYPAVFWRGTIYARRW